MTDTLPPRSSAQKCLALLEVLAEHGVRRRAHVVPEGVDDPSRVSGGNRYDREVCNELRSLGWAVVEHAVSGAWPRPSSSARNALARPLDAGLRAAIATA